MTLIQALLAAGAVVLLTIVADEWKRLREIEGEFKSEFRESLEKRLTHSLIVVIIVGAVVFLFGWEPWGIDAVDVFLASILSVVSWPLSRVVEERIFG